MSGPFDRASRAQSSCTICDESSREAVDDDRRLGVVDEVVAEQTSRMNLVQKTPNVSLWQADKSRMSQNKVWGVTADDINPPFSADSRPEIERLELLVFFRQPPRTVNSRDQCGRHPLYRFGQDLW